MKSRLFGITSSLLFVISFTYAQSFDVNIKGEVFTPQENVSTFNPATVDAKDIVENRIYRFIQFSSKLKSEELTALEQKGVKMLSFLPPQTYIASIDISIDPTTLVNYNARSIWELSNDVKLSDDIRNRSLPDWAIDGKRAKVIVKYFEDLDQSTVINKLTRKKIEIVAANGVNNFLEISVDLDQLEELGDLAFLENVEPIPAPDVKDDRRGRSLHRVNKLDPNMVGARNYTGKGISVVVRDDGEVFNHIDFKGRLNQSLSSESLGSHGDGVAGIMAGAGNLDPINTGMAHESFVYVVRYVANFLDDQTESLISNNDVLITNSSFTNGCNIGYTNITRIVDQQTFNNPGLMHVFSAGNAGEGFIFVGGEQRACEEYGAGPLWANITGGHKQGKNVIATANLDFRGLIRTSSSRGPSTDGRIKPDIAANGHNHVSTDETQGYMAFGGTSGAAPVVAGVMAMLHEAYEINHGESAKAALLKAMMLNTANDLGNKGPDFIYGWGSLNAYRAALGIEEGRFLNEEISQDEQKTHSITIPENVAEVKIMTYWPDPEGSTFSSVALINDLNTKLRSTDGTEYLPWVLDPTPDPAILSLPATKGVDNLNNMEQIAIDNPIAGEYTLEINGDQVPFGVNEYYVVWEFRMNEIDVIFPEGGENLDNTTSEVIHWDATGDEGDFTITHILESGEENIIGEVNGDVRNFQWFTPADFSEKSKIRVERNGISGESIEPFLLANAPRNLEVKFDSNRVAKSLHWLQDTLPVSYNIYVLGDTQMEKLTTIEADSFLIPDEPIYKYAWLSVTANYPQGTEGRRGRAVSTTPAPIALAINDKDNKPCVNQPIVFESLSTDTLLRYSWNFGSNSIPETADTPGPHTVIYTKDQTTAGIMTITNDGGEDFSFFVIDPQSELEPQESEVIADSEYTYTFKSKINGASTYTWDFGDGNTAEGKTVSHTYEEDGIFTVTLTAENSCGSLTEMNEVSAGLTSVKDLTPEDFIISPNPNQGDFYITLPDLEGNDLRVDVFTIEGKRLETRYISQSLPGSTIQWLGLVKGIYIMKFSIGQKEVSKKIVVE